MIYCFIDMESEKKIELDLEFEYLFENQDSGGFLRHNGKLLKRDVTRELDRDRKNRGDHPSRIVKSGPVQHRTDMAGAFHPDQVDEARTHLSQVHPGIEVEQSGSVKFSSRGARRAYLKDQGMFDRDGGYGDG